MFRRKIGWRTSAGRSTGWLEIRNDLLCTRQPAGPGNKSCSTEHNAYIGLQSETSKQSLSPMGAYDYREGINVELRKSKWFPLEWDGDPDIP
ncbi:hypothetical protein EDB86DRAFT_3069824 [Lactarius hatsudake]|nr:hypothetical protein EDB86DRAFT_3069824 [Lactarius hatsudake]